MTQNDVILNEEKIVLELRKLYCTYGYVPFRMSNFEEYELYVRNKDFLVNDSVIAFSDTNGRMLALKPDVTFSIIKSGEDRPGFKQKVCYNENVYRVSDTNHRFKEIMQSGLECIGDIDIYDIYEVITLAAESLALISKSFVLEVSCLDVISAVFDSLNCSDEFRKKALGFISKKNRHDLIKLCAESGISGEQTDRISMFIDLYGNRKKVSDYINRNLNTPAAENISRLSQLLDNSKYSDNIVFNFSVVNDMDYYNGFVFRGFIEGVSSGVLSGGQYDRMMSRLGRHSGAIGFAVYMDKLEKVIMDRAYSPECVVLYDDSVKTDFLISEIRKITESGVSVSALKKADDGFSGRVIDLRKEGRNA